MSKKTHKTQIPPTPSNKEDEDQEDDQSPPLHYTLSHPSAFQPHHSLSLSLQFLGFYSKFAKLDRHRGDRYSNNNNNNNDNNNNHNNHYDSQPYRHSRGPSRFSDGPLTNNHNRRSPNNFRGGANHRPFESPPRLSPGSGGADTGPGGFRPAGFRPMGGGGGAGGFGSNNYDDNSNNHHQLAPLPVPPPLSGQKRGFSFPGRGGSPGSVRFVLFIFYFLCVFNCNCNCGINCKVWIECCLLRVLGACLTVYLIVYLLLGVMVQYCTNLELINCWWIWGWLFFFFTAWNHIADLVSELILCTVKTYASGPFNYDLWTREPRVSQLND